MVGKGQGQPEKRAGNQVKAVGADKIRPQVRLPVPEPVPAADRLMGQLIERHLLDVKVPGEEIVPLFPDDKREKQQCGEQQRIEEEPKILVLQRLRLRKFFNQCFHLEQFDVLEYPSIIP